MFQVGAPKFGRTRSPSDKAPREEIVELRGFCAPCQLGWFSKKGPEADPNRLSAGGNTDRFQGLRVSDRTRTGDHLDHNQELYQLSYAHRVRPIYSDIPPRWERPRQDSNLRHPA
jgi:hypothetical protein